MKEQRLEFSLHIFNDTLLRIPSFETSSHCRSSLPRILPTVTTTTEEYQAESKNENDTSKDDEEERSRKCEDLPRVVRWRFGCG